MGLSHNSFSFFGMIFFQSNLGVIFVFDCFYGVIFDFIGF